MRKEASSLKMQSFRTTSVQIVEHLLLGLIDVYTEGPAERPVRDLHTEDAIRGVRHESISANSRHSSQ